jgi:hypothetical protein
MTKKRILWCLRVPPGVCVPPVEYHCCRELASSKTRPANTGTEAKDVTCSLYSKSTSNADSIIRIKINMDNYLPNMENSFTRGTRNTLLWRTKKPLIF